LQRFLLDFARLSHTWLLFTLLKLKLVLINEINFSNLYYLFLIMFFLSLFFSSLCKYKLWILKQTHLLLLVYFKACWSNQVKFHLQYELTIMWHVMMKILIQNWNIVLIVQLSKYIVQISVSICESISKHDITLMLTLL